MTYRIQGNLVPILRPRLYGGNLYDEHAKNKSIWLFSLGEQHGMKRMFEGPVALQVAFALPYPLKSSKATQEKLRGMHQTAFPAVCDLVKLLGELSTGILFNSDVIIVSVEASKIFCDDPFTEFSVTEVGNGKKND